MKKTAAFIITAAIAVSAASLSEQDSLKAELDRIAGQLEAAKSQQISEAPAEAVQPSESTCEKKKSCHKSDADSSKAEEILRKIDTKLKAPRAKGFGGAGGVYGGVVYLDMKPVQEVLVREIAVGGTNSLIYGTGLENRISDREELFMMGGMGWGGIGNGIRIGGGGLGGSREFSVRSGSDMFTLTTDFSYGGFMLAKSFDFDKHNVTLSGMAGSGSLDIGIFKNKGNFMSPSGLGSGDSKVYEPGDKPFLTGSSRFFAGEFSAAYTYSVLRWLHVGADVTGIVQYSYKGFNGTDGYTSISPMGRFRILFGRLG